MSYIKPFLKWVGGKTQILDDVLNKFPREIENYHEPFLGGGSVLLGLLSAVKIGTIKLKGVIYASDMNRALISLYKNIQANPDTLINEVTRLVDEFRTCKNGAINRSPKTREEAVESQESYYYWIRSSYNNLTNDEKMGVAASAMFLFLNKTCFRGVYREGPRGFNVPYGHYANPSIIDADHIRAVSIMIKDVVFAAAPFEESLARVSSGDFVYLDPPYAPETETSFVSYTADGFNIDMHRALFTKCKILVDNGINIVMSNADVPFIRDAFKGSQYNIETIVCRRAINSKKPDAKTKEVLIASCVN